MITFVQALYGLGWEGFCSAYPQAVPQGLGVRHSQQSETLLTGGQRCRRGRKCSGSVPVVRSGVVPVLIVDQKTYRLLQALPGVGCKAFCSGYPQAVPQGLGVMP